MPHLTRDRRSRFEKTDPKWLKTGAELADLANRWSKRSDIVSFVGEGAADGSAGAAFNPSLAEMEVNVNAAFGEGAKPEYLGSVLDRDVQFQHPAAIGAVLHEAMHAKHSQWDLMDCYKAVVRGEKDPFAHALITDFEETRIEARGVKAYPENRSFLRACALKLVLGDIKEDQDFASRGHQSVSKLMLLSMARVDAGVLDEGDVTPISEAALKLYGEELVGKLRSIWVRAQAHSEDDRWEPLHKLALEWIKLLEDAGHEPREEGKVPQWVKDLLKAMAGIPASPGGDKPGEDSDEEGEGSGGKPSEDGDGEGSGGQPGILEQMADETETSAIDEGTAQEMAEIAKEIADAKAAESKEQQAQEQKAAEVFGRGTGPGPSNTNSRLIEKRPPSGPERAAAVRLAKDLERARYRDRVQEEVSTQVPPGRLRMRNAMAASEQRSRGGLVTAEPWRRTKRHHTEDPNLTVGVMVDISGSMRRAMEPMAVTAWVLSEAVKRVQGKAAMMYFGNDVFPVLAPGQHLDNVHVYSASDGTERFNKGFTALNGKLRLVGGSGARLLVVVSDLYHSYEENQAETKWFERCARDGVAVIVIAPEARMNDHASEMVGRNGTVLTMDYSDPAAMARQIGAAAVKELQRASR